MNARYQKNTGPSGKTRKSAAAAKPKRASSGSPEKSKSSATRRQPLVINPPTEEFRYWRRIWWILLIGSVVFTFGSLAVRQWLGQETLATIMLGIGYAGIFSALALDWIKLRKMRREWMELQKSGKVPQPESKPAEKPSADDES
jgi:hypothetical protein